MTKTASLTDKYMYSMTDCRPSGSRKAGIGLFALQASADAVFSIFPVSYITYILSPNNNNYSRRPGLSCADGVTVSVTAAGRSV